MIEGYTFGQMTVDNMNFENDVEVRWDGTVLDWQREQGHMVTARDVVRVLGLDPQVIIFGTGHDGLMSVSDQLVGMLKDERKEVMVAKSAEAAKYFNQCLMDKKKVVGLFHLTC